MVVLRAGLYERVSTDEQQKYGYSIKTQIDALEEHCAENKMKIVDHYTDDGVSGGKAAFRRPQMSRLLEDMLTLSSSDTNQFSINKSPVELDTLLLDAYEIFEPMAKSKNQKLHINLPEELLPNCSCDKERIYQVLAILLHNAISYTPQNGSIHIKLEMIKDNFSISVSDTGIGIPCPDRSRQE